MIRWQPPTHGVRQRNQRHRVLIGLLMKAGVMSVCASALLQPRPWLVYNPSASVPLGFYTITAPGNAKIGDLVLAELPDTMRRLADERRYVPTTVPVLKVVSATAGDKVCAQGNEIHINGQPAGHRRSHDRAGRPMPWWEGCHLLRADEVFLFNAASDVSFDGRYTGIVSTATLLGQAHRL